MLDLDPAGKLVEAVGGGSLIALASGGIDVFVDGIGIGVGEAARLVHCSPLR